MVPRGQGGGRTQYRQVSNAYVLLFTFRRMFSRRISRASLMIIDSIIPYYTYHFHSIVDVRDYSNSETLNRESEFCFEVETSDRTLQVGCENLSDKVCLFARFCVGDWLHKSIFIISS